MSNPLFIPVKGRLTKLRDRTMIDITRDTTQTATAPLSSMHQTLFIILIAGGVSFTECVDADTGADDHESTFARTAREWAAEFGPETELINGEQLIDMLNNASLPSPQ